jgi:flagellar basal-body rod modification protein FlgD
MDIAQTQTGQQASSRTATALIPENETSALTSDFDTFLKMLTAQMKNKDPLNPIDSADYAVQLATFSGVEQQVQTNDLLRALGAGSELGGLAEHASWVGMQARSEGPIAFDGAPVDLHYDVPLDAISVELVVATAGGQELHRLPITGSAPFSWAGIAPSGTTLLAGNYALSIETRSQTGRAETSAVSAYSRVTEVRSGADGPQVVLANGATVAASSILALRADH